MKTALLITYHWPPSGGAGVHRWLKMGKFLGESGWRLEIFTPANAERPIEDPSLLNDVLPEHRVITHPIWEPYALYKILTGRRPGDSVYSGLIIEDESQSLAQRLSVWLRGNLFIPDPKRFWIAPSIRFLCRHPGTKDVDALISTGPPHSTHLIALKVARAMGLPWIADFRDPWTGIDYYPELKLTPLAHRIHKRLERKVLQSADRIVTVSDSWARDLADLADRPINVITNGFDPDDFLLRQRKLDDDFTLCHFGSMNRDRNPTALWRAISELRDERHPLLDKLHIKLFGIIDHEVRRYVHALGLEDWVQVISYVPHREAVGHMSKSRILLLPINRSHNALGVIPGKLYEYLGACRPVLLIGPPDGDAALIVSKTGSGRVVDFDDKEGVKESLITWFRSYLGKDKDLDSQAVDCYSRRALAGHYASLLNSLVKDVQK